MTDPWKRGRHVRTVHELYVQPRATVTIGPSWLEPALMVAIIAVVGAILVVTLFVFPHPVKS